LRARSEIVKKDKNTAHIIDSDCEPDNIDLLDYKCEERTLVLKTVPRSRRTQLMAQGVREIRCSCCDRIRPLAGAEDSEEGWICEDCLMELMEEPKYGGRAGSR
jgi:hypothetical protein